MCLAVIAYQVHPVWPIILVANRDEFHDRPSSAMHVWDSAPAILAGKDLRAGGTWLGLNAQGKIALLTNVREPGRFSAEARSRGKLVESFLLTTMSANSFVDQAVCSPDVYNGYNLLVIDDLNGFVMSNRPAPHKIPLLPGIHGLSNASLNTPWPKLTRTTESVGKLLDPLLEPDSERLLQIMQDDRPPDDALIPQTGLTLERERLLASPFIRSAEYGTRCTTILMRHRNGGTHVQEWRYQADGQLFEQSGWMLSPHGQFTQQT